MSICKEIKELIIKNLAEIISLRGKKTIKSDGSFVSEGDLLSEKLVKQYITTLDEPYFLISEESPAQNKKNSKEQNVIILDPIDGTENFVSGLKEWGVAVSIYKNKVHTESMLFLPELNESIISGDKIERFESRICGLSSSLLKHDLEKLESGFEYRIMGCSVYNMRNVITGAYHSFENFKGAWVWDIIPGLNLALENGLKVLVNEKDYNGELLEPDKKYRFKISNQ